MAKALSPLDAVFLQIESPTQLAHVAEHRHGLEAWGVSGDQARVRAADRVRMVKMDAVRPEPAPRTLDDLADPAAPAALDSAQRYLQEHDPASYAMLRTSIVPTILKAGIGAQDVLKTIDIGGGSAERSATPSVRSRRST